VPTSRSRGAETRRPHHDRIEEMAQAWHAAFRLLTNTGSLGYSQDEDRGCGMCSRRSQDRCRQLWIIAPKRAGHTGAVIAPLLEQCECAIPIVCRVYGVPSRRGVVQRPRKAGLVVISKIVKGVCGATVLPCHEEGVLLARTSSNSRQVGGTPSAADQRRVRQERSPMVGATRERTVWLVSRGTYEVVDSSDARHGGL